MCQGDEPVGDVEQGGLSFGKCAVFSSRGRSCVH